MCACLSLHVEVRRTAGVSSCLLPCGMKSGCHLGSLPAKSSCQLWFCRFFYYLFNLKNYVYICIWICAHEWECANRDQERVSDLLGLKLQAVVSCVTWVLGSKLKSSGKAASFLSHRAISSVPGSVDCNMPMSSWQFSADIYLIGPSLIYNKHCFNESSSFSFYGCEHWGSERS